MRVRFGVEKLIRHVGAPVADENGRERTAPFRLPKPAEHGQMTVAVGPVLDVAPFRLDPEAGEQLGLRSANRAA